MKSKALKTFLFLFLCSTGLFAQLEGDLVDVRPGKYDSKVKAGSELKFTLKLTISEGWHIHSNKPNDPTLIPSSLTCSDKKFILSNVIYPKPIELKSDISEKPLVVFEGDIEVSGTIKIPADAKNGKIKIPLNFGYQGCNDKSCMPPADAKTFLEVTIEGGAQSAETANTETKTAEQPKESQQEVTTVPAAQDNNASLQQPQTTSDKSDFDSRGLLLNLIIIFFGGLALNLTPCVYPLIPITIGYFGGQSEGRTGQLFILGLLYVLGISITYSVVGVITSLSGSLFGSLLQSPVVIGIICLIFLALALSMFGVYEFKMPDSWVMKAGGARSGRFGAFFMGLTMGIVAAPCVGPFVFSLITVVAKKADPFYGFLVFFILSLGLGLPYLILALFSGKLKSLPRAGLWMEAVKHIFGFIMIGMAIYFAAPLLPAVVNQYLLPVYGICASIYLLFFDKSANSSKGFKIVKSVIAILVIVVCVILLIPSKEDHGDWKVYTESEYSNSIGKDKIVIDFWATWCVQCKELDAKTFSNEEVKKILTSFKTLRCDLTKSNDETTKIYKDFKIISLPTVLIFDSKGNEVKRITGFMEPEKFLEVIKAVH